MQSDLRCPFPQYPVQSRGSAHTGRTLYHSRLAEDSIPMEPVTILASSDKNISEHVLCQDHIKLCRILHKLHGTVIYQHMFQGHTSGNPLRPPPPRLRQSLEESRTLALSTLVTFFRRLHGNVKAAFCNPADLRFHYRSAYRQLLLTPSTSTVFLSPK